MDGDLTDLVAPSGDTIDAFTFWVGDTLYALNIANVLSIVQDDQEISPVPLEKPGLIGVVRYHGQPVTVFDFAARLNVPSGAESRRKVIRQLDDFEASCARWVESDAGTADGAALDPSRSVEFREFGKWLRRFKTRDECLREAIEDVAQTYAELRESASTTTLRRVGDESVREQRREKLRPLCRSVHNMRQQISDLARPVILYVTEDGQSVSFAVRVDDLNHILQFDPSEYTPVSGDDGVVRGYLIQEGQPDCLLVNVTSLARDSIVATP